MKFIYSVLQFIAKNRRGGTTTLINKIASENDCYVVVRFKHEIKRDYFDIKEKCITLDDLIQFDNLPAKPVIFETQAIKEMCNLAKDEFEAIRNSNLKRDILLQKLKQSIIEFESGKDKIGSKDFL